MRTLLHEQESNSPAPPTRYDAAVVGAGPYGLSATAHLRGRGLKVAVFGKPLSLWREHMPRGMYLRSFWWATNLSDPHKQYGLEQYYQECGLHGSDPFPIESFIEYGLWFQKHAVPDIDETFVAAIRRSEGQYVVELVDGRIVQCPVVVMAPGLAYYTYRPVAYDHMPAELVSHTGDHYTFERFAGRRVVVIGGGQSALETAALLHESGADVQLISRSPILWIPGDAMANRTLIQRLRAPKAGIAPGWFTWALEHFPYAFQQLPRSTKDRLFHGRGRFGPVGAHWLRDRVVGKVLLHELQRVQEVKESANGVALKLSNNRTLQADHVVLGTGYRVDIKRLPMLHPSVVSGVQAYQGTPILNNRFESSLPGLYFIGFSSVSSCGPLYRFVVGTEAASRRVAGSVAQQIARMKSGAV